MLLSLFIKAQENSFFYPLTCNPVLILKSQEPLQVTYKKISAKAAISLPFFDDFSKKNVYPDVNLWEDSAVYINTDFPIAPPTIGVATFEGLNKLGYPYDFNVAQSSTGYADTLTSKPIDLALPATDTTIYFSFFYQARGRGNSPETRDSLSLEFKDSFGIWQKVWSKAGYVPSGSDTSFHPVIIKVQPSYFYSDFQFRFRNKATLSGSLDHWHIDYVYLDRSRQYNDTIIEDVAFAYRAPSLLKNYEAMPYKHYTPSEMKTNMKIFIKNNDINITSNKYKYTIYDNSGTGVYSAPESNANIPSFYTAGYQSDASQSYPAIGYNVPLLSDSTSFVIEHTTQSGLAFELSKTNDTIVHRQKFYNYFAYDDGTAELAYGPSGVNPAYLACRFDLSVQDTLCGVQIYFNPVLKDESSVGFRLTVWSNSGGQPGTVIYTGPVISPQYEKKGLNIFYTYPVDSLMLNAGSYFIGWTQLTTDVLNIGFDKNTNNKAKIFYNVGNGWLNPTENGSLLLRPVFGGKASPAGMEELSVRMTVSIYPNPASDKIYFDTKKNISDVMVYDKLGKAVLSVKNISSGIDVSSLAAGIYFISGKDSQQSIFTSKLIISR